VLLTAPKLVMLTMLLVLMLGSAGAPVIAVTDNNSPAHANQIGTGGQK
jgi:biotin transporter BioY